MGGRQRGASKAMLRTSGKIRDGPGHALPGRLRGGHEDEKQKAYQTCWKSCAPPCGKPLASLPATELRSWPWQLPLCNPLPHGALTERSHSFCPVPGPLPSLRLPAPQAGSRSAHAPAKAPAKARETAQKQNRNGAETFPKQFSLFRNIRRPRAASGRSSGRSSDRSSARSSRRRSAWPAP